MRLTAMPDEYAVVRRSKLVYEAVPRRAAEPSAIVDFGMCFTEALELAMLMSAANDFDASAMEHR